VITYKGLPAPVICDYLSGRFPLALHRAAPSFISVKLRWWANTGTYVDSPFHRFADGKDLSELALASLANLDGIMTPRDEREARAVSWSI